MKRLLLALVLVVTWPHVAKGATGCSYPTSLSTYTDRIAGDFLTVALLNQILCDSEKVQAELGTAPSAAFATVSQRLDNLLPLTGGTLSGNLEINKVEPRLALYYTGVTYWAFQTNADTHLKLIQGLPETVPYTFHNGGVPTDATDVTTKSYVDTRSRVALAAYNGEAIPGGNPLYTGPGVYLSNTDEPSVAWPVPFDGTIKNLYVRQNGTQPSGGDLTVTINKSTVATALTVTFAASSGVSTQSDTTHTATVSAGDLITIQLQNGSGSATSAKHLIGFELVGR